MEEGQFELIDKNKQDYLHQEGPDNGQWGWWEYDEECTCNACTLWRWIQYKSSEDHYKDYERICTIAAEKDITFLAAMDEVFP